MANNFETFISLLRNRFANIASDEAERIDALNTSLTLLRHLRNTNKNWIQLFSPNYDRGHTSQTLLVAAQLAVALSKNNLLDLRDKLDQLETHYMRMLKYEDCLFGYEDIPTYLTEQDLIPEEMLCGFEEPQFIRQPLDDAKARLKQSALNLHWSFNVPWQHDLFFTGLQQDLATFVDPAPVHQLLLASTQDEDWLEKINLAIDDLSYPQGVISNRQVFFRKLLAQPRLYLFRKQYHGPNPSMLFGCLTDTTGMPFYILYASNTGQLIYSNNPQKVVATLLNEVDSFNLKAQVIALKTSPACLHTHVCFQQTGETTVVDSKTVKNQCRALENLWKQPLPKRYYSLPKLLTQFILTLLGLTALTALVTLAMCDVSRLIGHGVWFATVLNVHPWHIFNLSSSITLYAATVTTAVVDVLLITACTLTMYALLKEAYRLVNFAWLLPKQHESYRATKTVYDHTSFSLIQKTHWVKKMFQDIKLFIEKKSLNQQWHLGEWGSKDKIKLKGENYALPHSMAIIYHTICKAEANKDYSSHGLASVNKASKEAMQYEVDFKWFYAYRECSVDTFKECEHIYHLTEPMVLPSEVLQITN